MIQIARPSVNSRTTSCNFTKPSFRTEDVPHRAWIGSKRAKSFYREQQRLWVELLLKFLPDEPMVEALLQLFQGAALTYLITGDPEPGRRSLIHTLRNKRKARRHSHLG